jgi:hypothetical protein
MAKISAFTEFDENPLKDFEQNGDSPDLHFRD